MGLTDFWKHKPDSLKYYALDSEVGRAQAMRYAVDHDKPEWIAPIVKAGFRLTSSINTADEDVYVHPVYALSQAIRHHNTRFINELLKHFPPGNDALIEALTSHVKLDPNFDITVPVCDLAAYEGQAEVLRAIYPHFHPPDVRSLIKMPIRGLLEKRNTPEAYVACMDVLLGPGGVGNRVQIETTYPAFQNAYPSDVMIDEFSPIALAALTPPLYERMLEKGFYAGENIFGTTSMEVYLRTSAQEEGVALTADYRSPYLRQIDATWQNAAQQGENALRAALFKNQHPTPLLNAMLATDRVHTMFSEGWVKENPGGLLEDITRALPYEYRIPETGVFPTDTLSRRTRKFDTIAMRRETQVAPPESAVARYLSEPAKTPERG